ncbi:MAG: UDP-N-acetylmuramoyl-tripeptide--D-alanyl-D-alanine ligase, partial [Oscillospiraceae bacterium]|nr:UDP-N-acetylmuramoyl-tripeptide--D-alanyl-D-alanine ligase [Oscillospiraceae bacterium]
NTKDAHIIIGKNYLRQFDPIIFAITGSVGKTTTKEMLALILQADAATVKNEANLNNEIGLPQTMFEVNVDTKYAVFEMGMNNLGDIRKLTLAAKPDVAIITTIGLAHIEYLKTKENILAAKLEIFEGLKEDGIAVINGDDDLLMGSLADISQTTVTFAIDNTDADVVAKRILANSNTSEFMLSDRKYGDFLVVLPAIGNHNVMNALAAYTAATRKNISPALAVKALYDYVPEGMRQNILEFLGITIIEDCYNANPDSMKAALQAFSIIPVKGLRIAVLGDMLELGTVTAEQHNSLILLAASCGIDVLLTIGEHMKQAIEAAAATSITNVRWFPQHQQLADYLIKTAKPDDAILFKASRSIKLETVIELFYDGYNRNE